MLEACRNNLSPNNISKVTQRINTVADSQDKKCTKAFVNAFYGEFETDRMTDNTKKAYLYNYINDLERLNITDPYERYVRLVKICYTAIGIEQSQVIKNYVREMIDLAENSLSEKASNGSGKSNIINILIIFMQLQSVNHKEITKK